jgi:hypothetical protein
MSTDMPYSKTTRTAGRDAVEQRERVHGPHLLSKQERKAQSDEATSAMREHAVAGGDRAKKP